MSVTLNQQGFYFYQLFQCFAFYASPFLFTAFTWQKSSRVWDRWCKTPCCFSLTRGGQSAESCTQWPHCRAKAEQMTQTRASDALFLSSCGVRTCLMTRLMPLIKIAPCFHFNDVTCAIRTVDCAAVLQHVPFPPTRLLFRCGPDADHQLCSPPYSAARLINDSCQRRCQSIGYSFWVCLGVGD